MRGITGISREKNLNPTWKLNPGPLALKTIMQAITTFRPVVHGQKS